MRLLPLPPPGLVPERPPAVPLLTRVLALLVPALLLLLAVLGAGCAARPDPQTAADLAQLGGTVAQCCAAELLPDGRCAESEAALQRLGVAIALGERAQQLQAWIPYIVDFARELWAQRCALVPCAGGTDP